MKITDIKLTKIQAPMARRYDDKKALLSGVEHRVIAKVTTDAGITGYGDIRVKPYWIPPPDSQIEPLIGRNPFDSVNNTLHPALGGAMYDAMGKYLELPAYKLMGQKLRDSVTVAAWCASVGADDFREEVRRAVEQGYMVFKMHTDERFDPIAQARAAAEVAPEGFKIHFDFNGSGRTMASTLSVMAELERNQPVVGFVEDPLPFSAIDDWRLLRQRTRIPIIMHVNRLGGIQEALHGQSDIYMLGDGHPDYSVGDILARGWAYSKLNAQTVMQFTGGTLTKALALHMACVLPTATGHCINLDDQYEEDVTTERIPVVEGFSPVPEGPGLGFEVDEEAIARFAANDPVTPPKFVAVAYLPGGHRIYTPHVKARLRRLTGREEGTTRGIDFKIWEDDGSREFEQVYERVHNDGEFME